MYGLLRPLIFRADPERTHEAALALARIAGGLWPLRGVSSSLFAGPRGAPVQVCGLTFPNRLGLAAGFDKDAIAWRGLATLGFGHIEIGTVTPAPQPGSPRPRVFRLVEDRSLVNRLGFPSRGAAFVAGRLRNPSRPRGLIVGVNIGKQGATPIEEAAGDYEQLADTFAPLADYLAVNISSPNTPELRRLHESVFLEPLLDRLARRRDALAEQHGRRTPILVKLSPDLDEGELERVIETILEARLDGIIATNTSVNRAGLRAAAAGEVGGLSGAALSARATAVVARIHRLAGGRLPIVASGGVMGARDARDKLEAGASLVQIYTGLVYGGPAVVRSILRELSR